MLDSLIGFCKGLLNHKEPSNPAEADIWCSVCDRAHQPPAHSAWSKAC